MADQAGRVAVVTGGGRGIGRAIALGLAGRGAKVAVVARGAGQLAETVALEGDPPGSVTAFPADVSDVGAVAAMAERVRNELGTPTILVNAAGMFGPIALIKDTDPLEWQRTVTVDAIAPRLPSCERGRKTFPASSARPA